MIDLHCHLLPAVDDGARSLEDSLEMARLAVADGISLVACTPHIYPGLYENTTVSIEAGVAALKESLAAAGIALALTTGADAHLTPQLLHRLTSNSAPTLGGTRYFLLEPPHHVAPPGFEMQVSTFLAAGYVPLITHPERLTWIDEHYDAFVRVAKMGAWLQVTSGSLTGDFGAEARYWAERLLDEGWVHILATDAHGVRGRRPELAKGRAVASKMLGSEEAERLVATRPAAILSNQPPEEIEPPPAFTGEQRRRAWWRKLL